MTRKLITLFALAVALQLANALVMWDEPVNVCSYDNIYYRGNAIATSDGCHLLIWNDTIGSHTNIWIQKFNAQHQPQWTAPVSLPFPSIFDVRVVETSDHNYLVFSEWGDYYHAWKLNSSGIHLWDSAGVHVFYSYRQFYNLDIKADHNGGAYLTWNEEYYSNYYQVHIQHLSSSGTTFSPSGFVMNQQQPSFNGPQILVLPDDDLIFACRKDSLLLLKRLNPDFSSQWELQLNGYSYARPGLADAGTGSFYLTAVTTSFVKAYRYSYEGVALWNEPVQIAASPGYPVSYYKSAQFSPPEDGSLIMLWADERHAWVQRLNDQGQALWTQDGIQVISLTSSIYSLGMVGDGSGGCFITANHELFNNNLRYYPIYAQHVSGNGIALPQQVLIKNALAPITYGSVFSGITNNGQLLLYWMDYANDTGGIYHQVMDAQGNLLIPEAETPFLIGNIGQIQHPYATTSYLAVPCLQNTAVFWLEKNILSIYDNRYQICYQMYNPAGVPLFPEGKRTIFSGGAYADGSIQAGTTPEGYILLAWLGNGLRAQLLDSGGNQLWEPNGRLIRQSNVTNWKLKYLDGAVYFIWNGTNSQGKKRIYGQKLVAGLPVWDLQGQQLVADFPGHPEYDQYLYDFNQGFLFFSQGSTGVYFLRLDTQVDPPLSSSSWGQPLAALPSPSHGQGYVNSYPLLDNLLVRFNNYFSYWDGHEWYTESYPYVQIISAAGDTLLGAGGIEPALYGDYATDGTNVFTYSFGSSHFSWCKAASDFTQEYSHSFYFPGSSFSEADVISLDNGNFLVLASMQRSDGYHLVYFYINPEGNSILPADMDLFSNPLYLYYNYCVNGNRIYPVWSNLLSGFNYCSALFLQKLSDGGVGVNDEVDNEVPVPLLSFPYPNPTAGTVFFSLKTASAAESNISVHNIKGQLIKTLHQGILEKGAHSFSWDGRNSAGKPVANGIYLLRVSIGKEFVSKRITVIR
jgi:hypothetical protein